MWRGGEAMLCVERGGGHVGTEGGGHVKDEVMRTKLIVGGPHVECGDQISPRSCPQSILNYPHHLWSLGTFCLLGSPGARISAPCMHS